MPNKVVISVIHAVNTAFLVIRFIAGRSRSKGGAEALINVKLCPENPKILSFERYRRKNIIYQT